MSQSLSPARIDLTPTTARLGRGGLVVAVLLHAAIVAATLFSWQHKLEITDESPPVVPVDLVTLADKTNIMPTVQKQPKAPPREDVKPPEPTPPTPAPPAPPQAEVAPPEPAPKTDDISALLNRLTSPAATPPHARTADRTIRGVGAMNAMTMDLIDSLNNQIAQCWSPPVGAPHPEQLRPQFRLYLNPDGSVAQTPQLTADSSAEAAGNPFMRAAVEAARRAIMTCQPYKLPADKYGTWKDITLDFDPSKMVQ
jgi:hypothetical protein